MKHEVIVVEFGAACDGTEYYIIRNIWASN